jgi:hypothetical protein
MDYEVIADGEKVGRIHRTTTPERGALVLEPLQPATRERDPLPSGLADTREEAMALLRGSADQDMAEMTTRASLAAHHQASAVPCGSRVRITRPSRVVAMAAMLKFSM